MVYGVGRALVDESMRRVPLDVYGRTATNPSAFGGQRMPIRAFRRKWAPSFAWYATTRPQIESMGPSQFHAFPQSSPPVWSEPAAAPKGAPGVCPDDA